MEKDKRNTIVNIAKMFKFDIQNKDKYIILEGTTIYFEIVINNNDSQYFINFDGDDDVWERHLIEVEGIKKIIEVIKR